MLIWYSDRCQHKSDTSQPGWMCLLKRELRMRVGFLFWVLWNRDGLGISEHSVQAKHYTV